MMKRLLFCIWLCYCVVFVLAQDRKMAVTAYIEDLKVYEQAINKILKERKYGEGIDLLDKLIQKSEKDKNYSLSTLADYYSVRAHGRLQQKQYPLAEADCQQALELLGKAGEAGKKNLSDVWYKLALIYYYQGYKVNLCIQADNHCVETALSYYGQLH